MANLIELIARWKDEGATAGLQKMTVATNVLTNAIGVGAGVGMIGSLSMLSRRLGQLIREPFEVASAMGALAQQMRAGVEVTKEAQAEFARLNSAVGTDGVVAFERLAIAEKLAGDSADIAAKQLARMVAPVQTMVNLGFAELLRGNLPIQLPLGGMPIGFMGPGSTGVGSGVVGGITVEAQRIIGPMATPEQLASAARMEQIRLAEAAAAMKQSDALKKLNEERAKERHEIEQFMAKLSLGGGVFGSEVDPAIAAREAFDRQMDEVFMQGRMIGPETLLESLRLTYPEITQLASDAGNSVANSLVWIASNFNNKMMTIGSAAKAFWNALVADILASLARLGLASLGTFLIGLEIGGPAGAVLGAIGAAFGGKRGGASAGVARSEGGNTYIFQGLNTRDMFMEVGLRSGSLARANDLVLMRSEAG